MKITDFDLTKRKNRTRLNALKKECKIVISIFPRSCKFEDIIICCDLLKDNKIIKAEDIGKSNEKSVEDLHHTMRLFELLDFNNQPNETIKLITNQKDIDSKLRELSMIASRAECFREWKKWEKISSIMDMKDLNSINFLKDVTHGRSSTISQRARNMNKLMQQIIEYHPSRNSREFPDVLPYNELKRQIFESDSIFEPDKLISSIKKVSNNAEFVRVGTGYLSINGYDLVARNLNNSQMRLLVGSDDTKGRMAISNAVVDLRNSLESGPSSKSKYEYAKKMRSELMGGGLRVRSLKARHTPDFHAKVQIYDKSAVVGGSANISYNGLIKNIENAEIIVDEKKIKYYLENFDNYFLDAESIEDEILEMLDDTWAISSDELIDPYIVYLRILLEMYGDSIDEEILEGISLADYQEYSVNKSLRDLNEYGGSLLVSPTGTGKTIMGTMISRRMKQMKKISRVFVVAPTEQILDKWEDEFLKLQIPFQGIPLSEFREQTGGWKEKLRKIEKSLCNEDLIVVDECHHIRNIERKGNENMLKTIKKPSKNSAFRLFLTATPISKTLDEMNNLLEFTHGNMVIKKSKDVATAPTITYLTHKLIVERFAKKTDNGYKYVDFSGEKRFFAKKVNEQIKYESSYLDEIIPIIKKLPLEEKVELEKEQMTLDGSKGEMAGRQDTLVKVNLSRMVESSPVSGLSFIEKKLTKNLEKKYYNGKNLRSDLKEIQRILNKILNDDSKLDACKEVMKEEVKNGKPVLIFCEYKETLRYLKNELEREFGVIIETITGEDSKETRKERCRRFSAEYHGLRKRKDDPKILIATDAIGEGVDLPDASMVINYDLFWTPLKLVQRVGRLDRPTIKKRSFRSCNMMPATGIYDGLYNLCSRLDNRSRNYKTMSGIEVFRPNIRDLDNTEDLDEFDDDYGNYDEDEFATEVIGHLAKASELDKQKARDLSLGTNSNYHSKGHIGIISIVKDGDGYTHLLSEFYKEDWGIDKEIFDDQETIISASRPSKNALPEAIPNSFYDRHERMLGELANKYKCQIDDLKPIVSLIKS
uniref:Uncharacterized protein n=1 Tax=uncultured Poseidoniia archaeon TaxID=1697135 RepID=A0A1B1TAC8_9ARCH|nr:hypothetical protein [uncultured Candidatus Thalassoarchaea sp.]